MSLEIEGKLLQQLEEASGVGKNGNTWRKQLFIIETEEQYPKKVAITAWNDIVEGLKTLKAGDRLRISFRIESREFNDKWYTDISAWKIVKISEQNVSTNIPKQEAKPAESIIYGDENKNLEKTEPVNLEKGPEDDLPF